MSDITKRKQERAFGSRSALSHVFSFTSFQSSMSTGSLISAPVTRERAHSTSTRPSLTLVTKRWKSYSAAEKQPCPSLVHEEQVTGPVEPRTNPPPIIITTIPRITLKFLRRHFMTYIYTNSTQHPVITVSVSSPLVDDDDDDSYLVLPMSASDKTTFDGHGSQGAFLSFKTFYVRLVTFGVRVLTPMSLQANTPLLWVMLMFPVSTALVYFALRSLPMTFVMPHNVSDLATLGREFHGYAQSGPWPMAHVIFHYVMLTCSERMT